MQKISGIKKEEMLSSPRLYNMEINSLEVQEITLNVEQPTLDIKLKANTTIRQEEQKNPFMAETDEEVASVKITDEVKLHGVVQSNAAGAIGDEEKIVQLKQKVFFSSDKNVKEPPDLLSADVLGSKQLAVHVDTNIRDDKFNINPPPVRVKKPPDMVKLLMEPVKCFGYPSEMQGQVNNHADVGLQVALQHHYDVHQVVGSHVDWPGYAGSCQDQRPVVIHLGDTRHGLHQGAEDHCAGSDSDDSKAS